MEGCRELGRYGWDLEKAGWHQIGPLAVSLELLLFLPRGETPFPMTQEITTTQEPPRQAMGLKLRSPSPTFLEPGRNGEAASLRITRQNGDCKGLRDESLHPLVSS